MHTIVKLLLSVVMMLVIQFSVVSSAYSYSMEEMATIDVYEKITPSVVVIDADIEDGVSSGTGVIIDKSGIILTSSHVIEDTKDINITLYNNEKYKARLLAVMGESNDLALLKIEPKKSLQTIKLGDSKRVKVGQKVLAIGNPFGFSGTLTTGIISRIDYERNKIQTDAAINPGSSGGPLVNMDGEVIGINQSIYNPDNNKSNIGIGFAVPVNAAKRLISEYQTTKKFAIQDKKTLSKK